MCETVVRYARAILAKNATIIEVKATLDKVCNFLPERMNQQVRKGDSLNFKRECHSINF